jgi:predicted MFS family arabinose efflux permease
MRSRSILVVLFFIIFLAITYETSPVGVLSSIGVRLDVNDEKAGLLIGVYAVVVAAGSIPLSALITRLPTRTALLAELSVFGASSAVFALTSDYGVAVAARLIGGVAHAVVFTSVLRAALAAVPAGNRGPALSALSAGNGLALAVGVPAVTALAAATDWRVPFVALTVAFAVVAVAAHLIIPTDMNDHEADLPIRAFLRALRHPALLKVGVTVIVVCTAHYASFTYINPSLTRAGATAAQLCGVLFVFGAASLAVLLVVSRVADRYPRLLLRSAMALLVVSMTGVGIGLATHSLSVMIVAVLLWGAALGAIPVLAQLQAVAASTSLPSAAAPIMNTSFNIGITVGAVVGGKVLTEAGSLALVTTSAVCGVAVLLISLIPHWLPLADQPRVLAEAEGSRSTHRDTATTVPATPAARPLQPRPPPEH